MNAHSVCIESHKFTPDRTAQIFAHNIIRTFHATRTATRLRSFCSAFRFLVCISPDQRLERAPRRITRTAPSVRMCIVCAHTCISVCVCVLNNIVSRCSQVTICNLHLAAVSRSNDGGGGAYDRKRCVCVFVCLYLGHARDSARHACEPFGLDVRTRRTRAQSNACCYCFNKRRRRRRRAHTHDT